MIETIYGDNYLRMDQRRHEVRVGTLIVCLTPIEFKLLAELVRIPGTAHSLEQLWKAVWSMDFPSLDDVKWHIKNLRRKLGFAVDGPIVTVWGFGYRYDPEGSPKENV